MIATTNEGFVRVTRHAQERIEEVYGTTHRGACLDLWHASREMDVGVVLAVCQRRRADPCDRYRLTQDARLILVAELDAATGNITVITALRMSPKQQALLWTPPDLPRVAVERWESVPARKSSHIRRHGERLTLCGYDPTPHLTRDTCLNCASIASELLLAAEDHGGRT